MREQQSPRFPAQPLLLSVLAAACITLLVTGWDAAAGTIKVWSTGETLKASDLNSNFAHIHNNMVGGHGARLVNGDVSATAAIAHSKLATPALVPRAWGVVGLGGACLGAAAAGTACTVNASSQVTSVTSSGTDGLYRVNLAYNPSNTNFAVLVTTDTNDQVCFPETRATTAPHVLIRCRTYAPVAANAVFQFLIMDDN